MKKTFKLITFFVLFLFIGLSFTSNVSADTGPKHFISIDIIGDTNGMYMTVLSKEEGNGPWSSNREYDQEIDEIDLKFEEYSLNDDFYYWYKYDDISDGNYIWNYYPPQTFKIVIYDSINDKIITNNEVYSRYKFESRFILKLNETSFTVEKNDDVSKNTTGFFVRVAICLSIEIVIALFFGLRKHQLLIVLASNVITQLLLNGVLSAIIIYRGFNISLIIPIFFILEVIILIIEFISYELFINKISDKFNLKKQSKMKLLWYTLIANLSSLILGAILLAYFNY